MPNGVFPVPTTSPFLSLRVLLAHDHLDAELAHGVDPSRSEALELRARQLIDRRSELADRIDEVIARGHERRVHFTAEIPIRRADVLEVEDDLHALASRLRDGNPVDVQGVALTKRLLTDGAGPLYALNDRSLRFEVRSARLALDPLGAEPRQQLRSAA
jgi:hypothetical protein